MSIETDYATLRRVMHEFNPTGWAVEFGVYSGYSLNIIADKMPVIGFDSFEGLPEDWRPGFPKGKFDMDMVTVPAKVLGPNRMIVPGWFEDTVPDFPFPPLGLVHIDCDLYSSTVTALEGVTPYVGKGTLFVFDEYQNYPGHEQHEAKAFQEWADRYDLLFDIVAEGEGAYAQEAAFVMERDV